MVAKRLFDLFFTVLGIIILLPLLLAIAAWIKLDSPGTVFFRQERVGRFGKKFRIYKFRTMAEGSQQNGRQLTVGDDIRITRSGKYLRQYKLDELPQLINVLKGKMSLVGPRPEVPCYMEYYPEAMRSIILAALPGITDYASIEYKDENKLLDLAADPEYTYITKVIPQKGIYYVEYIQNRSLLMDLKIIIKTFSAISR